MRLIQTNLHGFRQLVNRTFDFVPGMNLIYGPNEAGKSTLMEALAVLLYGYYGEGRIAAADRERLAQLMPWSGADSLGGSLRYQRDDGNGFLVERVFAPYQSASVTRINDGRDITSEFAGESEGRLYVGEAHLGINKDVFENLCRVRQYELALLEQSAKPISETIMRLSSSMAAEGTTVTQALEVLETAYREKVGTARSSTKPFARTKKQLEYLDQDVTKARAARQSAWERITLVQQDETPDAKEQDRLDLLLKKSQRSEIVEKLEQHRRLAKRFQELQAQADALSDAASFRDDLYEDLVRLSTRIRALDEELQNEPTVTSETQDALQEEHKRLSTERATLSEIPQEVVDAYHDLRTAHETALRNVDAARLQLESFRTEKARAQTAFEEGEVDQALVALGQGGLARLQQQYQAAQEAFARGLRDLQDAEAEWKRANMDEADFLALKETPASAPPKKGCKLIGRKDSQITGPPTELVIYNDLLPVYTRWKDAKASAETSRRAVEAVEANVRLTLTPEKARLI